MALGFSTAIRNGRLDFITTTISTSGLLRLYDGTRPATGGTATTKLAELPLSSTFAPGSSSGVLTASAITTANAVASGTATWFRFTTSGGTACVDGSVGIQVVTSASGTSGAATITVGSNSGIAVGNSVTGTGIGTNAVVVNISGTTITLSVNNSGTVSGNGTFNYDLNMTTNVIVSGQPTSASSFTITEGNP